MKTILCALSALFTISVSAQYNLDSSVGTNTAQTVAPRTMFLVEPYIVKNNSTNTDSYENIAFLYTVKSGDPQRIVKKVTFLHGNIVLGVYSNAFGPKTNFFFPRNLERKKTWGDDVNDWQNLMNNFRLMLLSTNGVGSPGKTTTSFGALSQESTRILQEMLGLPPTGIVDEATRAFANGLSWPKNFQIVKLKLTTPVIINPGETVVIDRQVELYPDAKGVFSVGLHDDTDVAQNSVIVGGAHAGEKDSENFNPDTGGDISIITPLEVSSFGNFISVKGTPKSQSVLWSSENLSSWIPAQTNSMRLGRIMIPLPLNKDKEFFKVLSP